MTSQKSNFSVKSLDFKIFATYLNILKTVWSKENSSAGYFQPNGCQIETSVLHNILMDEDNSFIACDHSSWEFPTGMYWILLYSPIIKKFSSCISRGARFDVYTLFFLWHRPKVKRIGKSQVIWIKEM